MGAVTAGLPGIVLKVLVALGDTVQMGQEVVRVESMKMEIPMESSYNGTVLEVLVKAGDFVNEGDPLIIVG